MKTSKAISLVMVALSLSVTPAFAQSLGGVRRSVSSHSRPSSSSHSRPSSSKLSRSSASSPNCSSSNSFNRATTTSSPKTNSSTTDSRSKSYSGSSSVSSNQVSTSRMSTSYSRTQTAKANVTHSRERMIQKRKKSYSTAGSSISQRQMGGNMTTKNTLIAVSQQHRGSNFVYSPQRNSVLKMYPSSANTQSSPRQINHSGLWDKCASNWYGNHTTNKSIVQSFANQNYNMDIIDYGFSEGILYCISEDSKGVFLQACDKDGKVLAEQKINRKYNTIVVTEENSGCWITKKGNKDPLYYNYDGKYLLKYEFDEGKEIIDFNYCEMVTYTITRENHRTYFQIYNDNDEQPLASAEINDCFNIVDVEPADCRCYIKNTENGRATEVIWLGDEIMFDEGE